MPSLGTKPLSSRSYLQRHHLPAAAAAAATAAALAQLWLGLRSSRSGPSGPAAPHPSSPPSRPRDARRAEPAGWRGRAPGVSARARRQLGAPSPPTPTRAHARRASTKQPGGVPPRAAPEAPQPKGGGREGSAPFAACRASARAAAFWRARAPSELPGHPPGFRVAARSGQCGCLPEGTDRDLHPLRWKPRRSSVSSAAAVPTFARRNRPPCRTSNPGRRVGS